MKAILLAGGKGTRMLPYTTVLPKPLLPIGEMPVLEILIRQLKDHGITEIVICVGYLGSLIEAYFGNGKKLGVSITYSHEDHPLGTAGPIRNVSGLTEPFFVMNGDLFTSLDFTQMAEFHRAQGGIATIGVTNKEVPVSLGVLELDAAGRLTKYIEKPVLKYAISMGIYVFEPEALNHIGRDERLDLPDLMLRLLDKSKKIVAHQTNCRWLDVGRPEDYANAVSMFEEQRAQLLRKVA